jgi:hypothetical protein
MRSIQRGELGHAKQLLFKIRDALGEQTPCPRIDDRVQMTMGTLNIDQRCKAKGMSDKNLGIEKKLVAFEDEFLRQKDVAYRKKQHDDSRYKKIITDMRSTALEKLHKNKEYLTEWDQTHKEAWLNTIRDNQRLISEKDKLESHLTNRILLKESKIRTVHSLEALSNGINKFEANA